MKILLIAPASGRWRAIGRNRFFNGRTFRFSLQSLLSVAAATPAGHELTIADEQCQEIPWSTAFDLVGITCMTALAPRAYALAERFRARGVPVVLGGMHPTLCTNEVVQHADAVVIGDAEEVWPQLLADLQSGRLQKIYRAPAMADLSALTPLPRHLLKRGAYAPVHATHASRGCPNRCSFCAVAAFSRSSQRYRPVEQIVAELQKTPHSQVIFTDDNLMADRDYARRLFTALIPLRKKWITQSTLEMADDPEVVRLAAEAGCVGVFVGLETFSRENLDGMNKGFNRLDRLAQAVDRLHQHGVGVEAGIVLGLPKDDERVFENTLRLLEQLHIDAIQVSCYTPLPGTPLFEQLADRICDRDWAHYDFHHAVFRPHRMSMEALQQGHDWLTREFYRPWRIARRLLRLAAHRATWRVLPFALTLNLAYLGRVLGWGIRGANPAGQPSGRVDATPVSHLAHATFNPEPVGRLAATGR